ncbi:MAG: tryptophan-rich sensory protein [Clostridia bacterium]|nr:tryptophan-rich sensory protein [Clostridia bacterium]
MKSETKQKIKIYIIAILIPLAVGGLSALLTMENMDIYKELNTPPLSPPAILFPIAWTILYILMGISSAIVWIGRRNDQSAADDGISLYSVSLVFNFLWSIFFFNLRWFLFSFIWLFALLILIIMTIRAYKKVDPVAAYLQIPYSLWVTFAGYLNLSIWILNK